MHECLDVWMHGGMDGWMDGSMDAVASNIHRYVYAWVLIRLSKVSLSQNSKN